MIRSTGLLLIVAFFPLTGQAGLIAYEIINQPASTPSIRFQIPYSNGTHDGEAHKVDGQIQVDPENPKNSRGSFKISIVDLKSESATRDCHMREALGLNYPQSEYPEEHVCDKNDQIPLTGVNSISYPEIEFKVRSISGVDGAARIPLKEKAQILVEGDWIIHGVSRPGRIPMTLTPNANGYQAQGKTKIQLPSHGIGVKPARILFFSITVDDTATVFLDLRLKAMSKDQDTARSTRRIAK